MAAIKVFQFGFFGSFQCRLATDPDPTGAFQRVGGWTYDLGEPAGFDRIIRLSSPKNLRTGLVDHPWADTNVIGIQTDTGTGLKPVAGPDPFMGQMVSFGTNVKFDSAAGRGASREALINFELSVGPVFKATVSTWPQITTTAPNVSEQANYIAKKKGVLAGLPAGDRKNSYATTGPDVWQAFYGMMGTVDDAKLDPPTITASSGCLKDVATRMASKPPGTKGKWVIHIDFYHFDGDTLCGDCNGWVTAQF
jgi:hypothetical protein